MAQELPGLDEDPINYVDDIPANNREQRRALLARMRDEGVRASRENRMERRRDRRFEDGRSRDNYDRGLAIGAPEASRAELDAERAKLLGGFKRARGTHRRGHSREMDRIAAANIAYLEQVAAASVLNKQRMDQMIEAMKLAAEGRGGGGGGGGWSGGGGGGGIPGIPMNLPEGEAPPDLNAAANGAQALWDALRGAAQQQQGADFFSSLNPFGNGNLPWNFDRATPNPFGRTQFGLGPNDFGPTPPPASGLPDPNMNSGAFSFSEWLARTIRGSEGSIFDPPRLTNPTVTPVTRMPGSSSTPAPATTAVSGLGAAIAAALAAAGGQ